MITGVYLNSGQHFLIGHTATAPFLAKVEKVHMAEDGSVAIQFEGVKEVVIVPFSNISFAIESEFNEP